MKWIYCIEVVTVTVPRISSILIRCLQSSLQKQKTSWLQLRNNKNPGIIGPLYIQWTVESYQFNNAFER